jgi:organic hydroperoxide reductase OsmC/OhrA
MAEHHGGVRWRRTSSDFTYDTYNRAHEVRFKNGALAIPGSAAPDFKGDSDRLDPEEAFVASLSACHMLTFLAAAARKRLMVDAYADDAVGYLEKGSDGKFWMARAVLRPVVHFAPGVQVDKATLDMLHHLAHDGCFIANSVKTDVTVEPQS